MPNLGLPELVIIAVVLIAVAAFIILTVTLATRKTRHGTSITPTHTRAPDDLDGVLRDLIARGRKIHAIKLLREHTGLGLKQAKDAVEALAAGRIHPGLAHPALQPGRPPAAPDLASRVRELKGAGRDEQAVHLVVGETGMGWNEAEIFVRAL
ncbi:ribosomal protein L7/L12 [Nonomuraea sp. NPDC059194]|uniref:ribosomal protein L7/L12 n=1 Tax=Nonomuraea sp. NPDC059194 TaxID=3346764 RepID=UPI0036C29A0E